MFGDGDQIMQSNQSGWVQTREFASSAGAIRYDVLGDGPPLVLVHGTPWSSYNWRHVIPALAEWWRVYFYDLAGYGQSEKYPGQDVSLGIQNQVLGELLDFWELEAPLVVGHDFGGTTVLRTHLLDRRDFRKIALVDPVAIGPWGSPFFRLVREHPEVFEALPREIHRAVVSGYVRGASYNGMDVLTIREILRPWTGEPGQGAFYRQIAQADPRFTDEIEPLYPSITRPVLILWGEEDQWIPLEKGEALHRAIPASEFHTIPEAGHLVQEDAPARVVGYLIKFFLD